MEETFSYRLKKSMKDKGVNISELSRLTKIGKSTISRYLSGDYIPKEDNLRLIASTLDVNPLELLGLDALITRPQLAQPNSGKNWSSTVIDDAQLSPKEIKLIENYRKASDRCINIVDELLKL